jgi:hypothetical protein
VWPTSLRETRERRRHIISIIGHLSQCHYWKPLNQPSGQMGTTQYHPIQKEDEIDMSQSGRKFDYDCLSKLTSL